MLRRRTLLKIIAGSALSDALLGCSPQLPACPVFWIPGIYSPVFYGYADFDASCTTINCIETGGNGSVNAPLVASDFAVRVYYPTLDGSPQNARLLTGCRRYPLVLFIHGDCSGDPYTQWIDIPAQLARSGYVVVVTSYGGTPTITDGSPSFIQPLETVYMGMRRTWQYKDMLMPEPATAIVGHSYGALLAAQLAGAIPHSAFASLSGAFGESNYTSTLPQTIAVPSLFLWGATESRDEVLYSPSLPNGQSWQSVRTPTHAVSFRAGHHADYMEPNTAGTCDQTGSCPLVRSMAADFLTAFLAKYMPPEGNPGISSYVPDSLFIAPGSLPPLFSNEQKFYDGSYLVGFAVSTTLSGSTKSPCVQDVYWRSSPSATIGQMSLVQA